MRKLRFVFALAGVVAAATAIAVATAATGGTSQTGFKTTKPPYLVADGARA